MQLVQQRRRAANLAQYSSLCTLIALSVPAPLPRPTLNSRRNSGMSEGLASAFRYLAAV